MQVWFPASLVTRVYADVRKSPGTFGNFTAFELSLPVSRYHFGSLHGPPSPHHLPGL